MQESLPNISKIVLILMFFCKLCFQIGGPDHKENSLENASETMSTNSASSPVPFVHNHSIEINDSDKRRHKSSSDDSKVRFSPSFNIH